VKRTIKHHSISVEVRDIAELEEEVIVKRLRAAGGADYNGAQYTEFADENLISPSTAGGRG